MKKHLLLLIVFMLAASSIFAQLVSKEILLSPNKTLYIDTIQGAEMYEFGISNDNENYTLKSLKNNLALYKIKTLGSGNKYDVKVRVKKNKTWGEWVNVHQIEIANYKTGDIDHSSNPIKFDSLNEIEYKEPMKVFDRFGNEILVEDIKIKKTIKNKYGEQVFGDPQHIITAGMFDLYIEDVTNSTNIGFDAPNGVGLDRQKTIAQVFLDLSHLITTNANMGTKKIRIYIENSNVEIPDAALAGASQYYGYGNGVFKKKGNVELFIQTGNDPSVSDFHGYLEYNFNHDWKNNIVGVIGDEYDLYSITLHECMHLLGFSSLIMDYEGNGLNNSFSPFAANMVYLKGSTEVSVLIEDNNKYILNTVDGVVLNQGCDNSPTLYYKSQCALDGNTFTPIYNPVNYKSGSSLSHFNCENTKGNGYVMNYSFSKGEVQRNLHVAEISVLHDIGYNLSNQYGAKYGAQDGTYSIKDVNDIVETYSSVWTGIYIEDQSETIALESFGACSESVITVIGVDDSYEDAVLAGNSIVLNVSDIISNDIINNDVNIEGITDVKIIDGGFTDTHLKIYNEGIATEYYEYTIPKWFGGDYAKIQYTPIDITNGKTTKGRPAFISIKIKVPTVPPCDINSCNLICHGDFEFFTNVKQLYEFFGGNAYCSDLTTERRINSTYPTYLNENSMDFCYENEGIMYSCQGPTTIYESNFWGNPNYPIPLPKSNGTDNYKYCAVGGSGLAYLEYLNIKLNKKLKPNTRYRLTYDYWLVSSSSSSSYLPCKTLVYLSDNETSKFDLFLNPENNTPEHHLIISHEVETYSKWETASFEFTTDNISDFEYLIMTQVKIAQSNNIPFFTDIFNLYDNIELYEVDQRQITVSSVLSNDNPCIDEQVTITYTIERESNTNDILTLQANILGTGLNIISEAGGFDNSGKMRIYPNDWQGTNSIQKTLTLNVINNKIQGTPISVKLNVLSEQKCLNDIQEEVNDIITPGVSAIDNISITKNIENKETAYHQDEYITYSIVLENNGYFDITEIVIEDEIPAELDFISSDANYEIDGNKIYFMIDNLSASNLSVNPISNSVTIQYTCKVKNETYTCSNITTTASLIEGSGLCELPIQAAQEIFIIDDNVDIQVSDNVVICKGVNATLIASGGTSYSWSSGVTTASITVSPTLTTTYTVTINIPNCTVTDNVVVNVLLSELNLENKTICEGESYTINATGGTSYTWSNGNTTASTTVSPTLTTTYVVTAYMYDCSATDQMVITVIGGTIPTVNITSTQTDICEGSTTTLTATGGSTYAWNNEATSAGISVTPSKTTIYTVTAITSSGCSGTDNIIVTVNTIPIANAGIDQNICLGQTATLTATGGGTYSWSTTATTATITVSPTETTTYIVTVTNGICSNTSDVIIIVNENPIANAGIDQTICLSGETVTLTATGGTEFFWGDIIYLASKNVSPTETTTYTVTVSQNGCSASDDVIVHITNLTVNIGENRNICQGDNVILTTNTNENCNSCTYFWACGDGGAIVEIEGATDATITVSPINTISYYVTVTDGNFCTASSNVRVTVNPLPSISEATNKDICIGSSTTIIAIPCYSSYNYSWNTGIAICSTAVSPTVTTTYTVTVTNEYNCSNTTSAIVTVNSIPTANASIDQTICAWQNQTATLTASGGDTYSWNTGVTNASISVSPNVTTTYTVTVTNNGCSATDQVVVTVSSVTANPGPHQDICLGESATLTASGGDTYSWSNGVTTASTTVSPTNYSNPYYVTVTDGNGCTASSSSVIVTVHALPSISEATNKDICIGSSTTIIAIPCYSSYNYSWNTGIAICSTAVSPTVTTTYTVTVTNEYNCSNTTSAIVTVNTIPIANAGDDQTICSWQNQTVTLTATGGSEYKWNTGGTNASISVNLNVTTTYTVTVTNNGCSATDQVVVIANSVTANAGPHQTICSGESATLTASGGDTYSWSNGVTTASTTVSPTNNSNYYHVTVTDNNGCTASSYVIVTVNSIPTANAGIDQTICSGESTTLTASGGGTYSWNTGGTNASISVSPNVTTTYIVTATDGNGCTASSNVVVTVNPSPIANAGIVYFVNGELVVDANSPKSVTIYSRTSISSTNTNCAYSWSTGETTQAITIQPATTGTYTYTLTITDNTSYCTNVNTLVINCVNLVSGGSCGTVSSSVTNIMSTRAQINWNHVDYAIGYMVRYRILNGTTWNYLNPNPSSLDNAWSLTSLNSNTAYEYQIRTFCDGGYYSAFITGTFTTLPPCTLPSGLSSYDITKTSAVVLWDGIYGVTEFLIRYKKTSDATWLYATNTSYTDRVQLGCGTCAIEDQLSPNTEYQWQVMSFCDAVTHFIYSPYTAIQTFTTLSAKSLKETIASKENSKDNGFLVDLYPNPTNNNATIDLTIPQDTYLKIELYDILGSKIADIYRGNVSQGISKYTVNTKNLKPNTYIIRVIADKNISHQRLIITE